MRESSPSQPIVVATRADLARELASGTGTVGLVMTMGALHEGHLSLVKQLRADHDKVVVSIFVNPEQFGRGEDFETYPRNLDADLDALASVQTDIVYVPPLEEVYPRTPRVKITPGPAGRILEGSMRPGHFDGVLQVVGKVLNLIRPDTAIFGQKDAQQFVNISQMVEDLDLGVQLIEAPIVREPGGLALSSRNAYLSETERVQAQSLHRSLVAGSDAARSGQGPAAIVDVTSAVLSKAAGVQVQYVALADQQTFEMLALWTPGGETLGVEELATATDQTVDAYLLVAAKVGSARLIDNMKVQVST